MAEALTPYLGNSRYLRDGLHLVGGDRVVDICRNSGNLRDRSGEQRAEVRGVADYRAADYAALHSFVDDVAARLNGGKLPAAPDGRGKLLHVEAVLVEDFKNVRPAHLEIALQFEALCQLLFGMFYRFRKKLPFILVDSDLSRRRAGIYGENIEMLHPCSLLYHRFFKLSITPRATESSAAIAVLYSSGSRKVIVCAGIQKNGIVFSKVKDIKPSQSTAAAACARERREGIGASQVSVIL